MMVLRHHSRYLLLTNNYSHDPTPDSGNHNGMEIDDGSQHVFGANNKTENCFGGLKLKHMSRQVLQVMSYLITI